MARSRSSKNNSTEAKLWLAVLTPGRYVRAEEVEDDGGPFEKKMPRLAAELHAQLAELAGRGRR